MGKKKHHYVRTHLLTGSVKYDVLTDCPQLSQKPINQKWLYEQMKEKYESKNERVVSVQVVKARVFYRYMAAEYGEDDTKQFKEKYEIQ